jgi:hypothetical protein
MQPIQTLSRGLAQLTGVRGGVFATQDLRALLPNLSDSAFKTLLSRAVGGEHVGQHSGQHSGERLQRVCRGVYAYGSAAASSGLLLFHAAAVLRANGFNYISLETALSAQGLISQVPMNWVSIMSSGRSSIVPCGAWGTMEFVHTSRQPNDLADQLAYDAACHLWRAGPALALRDMRATRRSLDLVNTRDLPGGAQ